MKRTIIIGIMGVILTIVVGLFLMAFAETSLFTRLGWVMCIIGFGAATVVDVAMEKNGM